MHYTIYNSGQSTQLQFLSQRRDTPGGVNITPVQSRKRSVQEYLLLKRLNYLTVF